MRDLSIEFDFRDGTKVLLNHEDIGDEIRDPKVSFRASLLSQDKAVREYLWAIQRRIGRRGGVVLEGRDTGSVVFPDAHVKFYLDAGLGERARRRHAELMSKGVNPEDRERGNGNGRERQGRLGAGYRSPRDPGGGDPYR